MKYMSVLLLILSFIAFAAPESGFTPSTSQLFPSVMVRYSTPIKVSGVLGLVFMRLHGHNSYSGFFTQIEPGIAGGKINIGYRYGEYRFMPVYNIGLAASVMQTWSDPLQDVEGGQTYMGLELVGALTIVVLNGGIFKHVAGDDEDSNWIYTLGIGLGI